MNTRTWTLSLAQSLDRRWLVVALAAVVLIAAQPAQAVESAAADTMLIKRVQSDGTARWERVSGTDFRSMSADGRREILAVSEDATFTQSAVPNDPLYPEQWNFAQIQAEAAWTYATGQGVVVAVVDTGLTPGPDLGCRTFIAPYDALSGGTQMADIADGTGHGTHVTGTIAQCTNNGQGVAGLAYGVSIIPIRALDDTGTGSAAWIANGIAHAVENGADVINLSLGMECGVDVWPTCGVNAVDVEIAAAAAAGVVVVAASGNNSSAAVQYPANHPSVISVGATNSAGLRASYSNSGSALDVMAPGGDAVDRDGSGQPDLIWQERPDESGGSAIIGMYGTSMAAPHVSATIALMKQTNPTWTPVWNRCVLRETARDLGSAGFDTGTGWGEIVPVAAITHTGEAWSDVNAEWYEPAVSFVADAGIAFGYADCTFRPSESISRAEAATMLVRAMGLAPVGAPTGIFPDVPQGSVFAPFVEAAALEGWILGYPDGTFRPDDFISRAELSAFVARASGFTYSGVEESPFLDVSNAQWFYDEVLAAWAGGAVNGYPNGSFLPSNEITRAESTQVLFNISG